jgi:hypothetical protein
MVITTQRRFEPGDLPPEGYLAWHEWAEVQRKAGIGQVLCRHCRLWRTPQELAVPETDTEGPVCRGCATSTGGSAGGPGGDGSEAATGSGGPWMSRSSVSAGCG